MTILIRKTDFSSIKSKIRWGWFKFLKLIRANKFNSRRANVFWQKIRQLKFLNLFSQKFFLIRHAGLIVLALFILAGNILIAKSMPADIDLSSYISLSDPAAFSEDELVETIQTLSVYTPNLKEDPQKITQKLTNPEPIVMVNGGYLAKPQVLGETTQSQSATDNRQKGIFIYTVKGGDTIGSIAQKFSISVSTIKSTNGLGSDIIQPGQKLHIPSADGVIHTVSKGENLISIVSKYSGDLTKTISENNLSRNAIIFAGQKIIVVGGKIISAPTQIAKRGYSSASSGISVRRGNCGNRFPFGWCTWWVAQKRCIPWRGNARAWPYQARRSGFQVGRQPVPGAIMVTNESWWGHVAYVESVNGGSVTISEMNFVRWGRVNTRTLSASAGIYIY